MSANNTKKLAQPSGLPLTSCSRSSEIQRLRALFPEILRNLESGDCVVDCSLEFLEQIPNEVKHVVGRLKRERDEARREALRWQDAWMNETPLHVMGGTVLPWMRGWQKSPENV